MTDDRVPWTEAEPARLESELAAVQAIAPDLVFDGEGSMWSGVLPVWPFDRAAPEDLEAFVSGRRFTVRIEYSQAFPMVAPSIHPVEPSPPVLSRVAHAWHLNGDGSLCLLQGASAWDGTGSAADLVVKAASWFLEYLLLEAGTVDSMSEAGIVNDASLDHLFAPAHDR